MQVHPRAGAGRRRERRRRAAGRQGVGQDPDSGDEITLRSGRFGDYVQQGEGEKPKRSSLPRGLKAEDVTLEKALALLSLPREVALHPTSGEPSRPDRPHRPYVQHGKTCADLGLDDDVLAIGGNRAIDPSSPRRAAQAPRASAAARAGSSATILRAARSA